jgi:hypothetical protein
MLVLLCVQVVKTNNTESSWRKKKEQQLSSATKQKICELATKEKKSYLKIYIINKIHKLIVKELKLNVNWHIKTSKNYNLLQI